MKQKTVVVELVFADGSVQRMTWVVGEDENQDLSQTVAARAFPDQPRLVSVKMWQE